MTIIGVDKPQLMASSCRQDVKQVKWKNCWITIVQKLMKPKQYNYTFYSVLASNKNIMLSVPRVQTDFELSLIRQNRSDFNFIIIRS